MDWLRQMLDPQTIDAWLTQFSLDLSQPAFWVAVGKITWINILLSGDNALVIAMACRGLQPRQRLWGMVLGSAAAVLLRIVFTGLVAKLMELAYLKLIGGLALLVIAAKLLVPEREDEGSVKQAGHLWAAIQIVVVADIVMSLDNVIAVAAAANGNVVLLILGLAISVPLIVGGAALIMVLFNRLPILIWAGAALLGWVAGDVMATDPAVEPALQGLFDGTLVRWLNAWLGMLGLSPQFAGSGSASEMIGGLLGAIIVLLVGAEWRRRRLQSIAHASEG